MELGFGIVIFLVYIAFVMVWYLGLKRSIAEAMLLGLVLVCLLNGVDTAPQVFVKSLRKALKQDVMAAIMLFTLMASIMTRTGIITRLVNILNSFLGRLRGGPAYVSACGSALFGMVSGASSANAATVGSITIPWMKEDGWPSDVVATMNTGNAGLGIAIPLVVITGPVGKWLETVESFGSDGVDAMNIIIWVPVLIMVICIIEGRKLLPKTAKEWGDMLSGTAKTCCSCGAVSLFAMACSNALNETTFGDDMTTVLNALSLPKFVMILIIGFVVALVAGPMNATSTTVSMGPVAYSAMVAVGVPPVTAIVAYLIFASTEGASPPMSSPIFVSSSIAGVDDVSVMFKPLIFHYCIPLVFVGVLVAMGFLPIPV